MSTQKDKSYQYDDIHSEVARLQKGQEIQEVALGRLQSFVETGFSDIKRSLDDLRNNQKNQGKANWPSIISAVSVILFAIAAVTGPIALSIESLSKTQDQIISTQNENFTKITNDVSGLKSNQNYFMGKTSEQINALKGDLESAKELTTSKFENIDQVLQREMRILDEAKENKIEGLEDRLEVLEDLVIKGKS